MASSAGAGATGPTLILPDESLALTPVVTSWDSDAHGAFIETLTALLQRLKASDDANLSKVKRVSVRGELYLQDVPGVKFTADFKDGHVTKVRVMTVRDDADKSHVPAEYGGTGLMAPAILTLDEHHDEPFTSTPASSRRKRAKTRETPADTLVDLLAKACELAQAENRTALVAQIDALLKLC